MFTLKFNETFVYDEKISFKVVNYLSRFVYFGHLFHLIYNDKNLFIPANNSGWKWFLDHKDTNINASTIKLYEKDESLSYMAIHFNSEDPAPHPINYSLHVPEFIGNYFTIEIEDELCRIKKIVHKAQHGLEIDNYIINFKNIIKNKIQFEIHS